ncbi:MAG: hypothetical protein ACRC2J_16195 [Microcoleaceae cyanobacterium]
MSKLYQIAGYFFLGVSITGLISYSSYTFQLLKNWGISLGIISILFCILAAVTDDAMIAYFKTDRLTYLGSVIGLTTLLIIGVVIQWQ